MLKVKVVLVLLHPVLAETIIELGIDWVGIETSSNLRTGLVRALNNFEMELAKRTI